MHSIALSDVLASVPVDVPLSYAEQGVLVLPLHGKKAFGKGLHAATTDPDQIIEWWKTSEPLNIGGRFPHCLGVDIDPQNGGSLHEVESAIGQPLPETLTIVSGRGTNPNGEILDGGGQTRIYAIPTAWQNRSFRKNQPGVVGIDLIDYRRAYSVIPPSRHPATFGEYSWEGERIALAPISLLALFERAETDAMGSLLDDEADEDMLPLWLVDSVRTATERNNVLHWALHRTVDEKCFQRMRDPLCQAAFEAGLPLNEIITTVKSVIKQRSANCPPPQ